MEGRELGMEELACGLGRPHPEAVLEEALPVGASRGGKAQLGSRESQLLGPGCAEAECSDLAERPDHKRSELDVPRADSPQEAGQDAQPRSRCQDLAPHSSPGLSRGE